jgi:hypothetical protein
MEDPFLNYFALGLLLFVVIVLVYRHHRDPRHSGPHRQIPSSSA